ncbi:ribosome recycling factor [Patescibacteria group bacterium]
MDESLLKSKLQEIIELITTDVSSIRTGRAHSGLVEDIDIDAYGGQAKLKLNELATITVPDANSIIIDPYDNSIIGEIKKGILAANLGLSPNIDGEVIRISIPPMTTEDREKYVKLLSQKIESGRIMVRQVRGEFIKEIDKLHTNKEMSDDEKFAAEKRLQEIIDDYIETVEEIGEKKKAELLSV